jgi:negative regulator of sigma E activity
MTLRTKLAALFALLLAALATPTLAAPGKSVAAPAKRVPRKEAPAVVLRDAIYAPNSVSYVGEVQMLRIGPNKSEAAVFRIEHKAPDLTRRWYLAPEDLYGDSIISRGDDTFSIDVKRAHIVVTHDDPIDDQVAADDNLNLLSQNYQAIYAPESGTVAGHRVDTIVLDNKYTGLMTMRVYVDSHTKLVLEKELYAPNGSLVSQTRFEAVRYTNAIPEALFEVPKDLPMVQGASHDVPSADLATVMRTAGFDARGPTYLPEGFTPVGGEVTTVKGVRSLHLVYSDGLRTVSLFENKNDAAIDLSRYKANETRILDAPAKYVEDGPTTLLAWSDEGIHYALVGDMTLTELEQIGASVGRLSAR